MSLNLLQELIEKIDLIAKKALDESGINLNDLDAVAVTAGPGLIVCLSVGLNFGKTIAGSLKKPFIAVNHLEGHALSPKLFKNKLPLSLSVNIWRTYSIFICGGTMKI